MKEYEEMAIRVGDKAGIEINKVDSSGLIETMLEPQILSSMLAEYGYLPTQISIGEGPYSGELRKSIPYYDQLISLIEYGRARPNIAEYPQIADHIREAIDQVYNGTKEPEQALDDAAAKSAKTLGW
jgi:multiple sugar transport system substrate-binding protein